MQITLPTEREAFIKRLKPLEWKPESETSILLISHSYSNHKRIFQRKNGKWSFEYFFDEMNGSVRYETAEIAKQAYWDYYSEQQWKLCQSLQSALTPETDSENA